MITQELLHQIFDYRDGHLFWKIAKPKVAKNSRAGSAFTNKYIQVKLNQKRYYIHRLIYLYHHGILPQYIDHIDGNSANNKIENLRPATQSQNLGNSKQKNNNTSGYKGVCWDGQRKKWLARIQIHYQFIHIGRYNSPKEAAIAYNNAALHYFGKYAKLNEVQHG